MSATDANHPVLDEGIESDLVSALRELVSQQRAELARLVAELRALEARLAAARGPQVPAEPAVAVDLRAGHGDPQSSLDQIEDLDFDASAWRPVHLGGDEDFWAAAPGDRAVRARLRRLAGRGRS